MSKPEQKIQIAVANWLTLRYPDLLWTISPSGMVINPNIAVRIKRMGYRPGTPDLLIFEPRGAFHGLFIELKAEGGRISIDQSLFLAKAAFLRYATAVCWSYEEAIKTVENYMNQPIGKGVRTYEQDKGQGCGICGTSSCRKSGTPGGAGLSQGTVQGTVESPF